MAPRPWFKSNRPLRYGGAVLAVAAAWLVQLGLAKAAGGELPPFLTFFPAIMLAALLAGFGPALLATIVAAGVICIWLLPPYGMLAIDRPADAVALAFFAGTGVVISGVCELYRRARSEAAALKQVTPGEEVRDNSAERTGGWAVNAAMAVSLTILIAAGWIAAKALASASRADQAAAAIQDSRVELDHFLSLLQDAETGQRGYLLTGDTTYLEPYQAAVKDLVRQEALLERRGQDNPHFPPLLARLKPLVHDKLAELAQTIEIRRTNGLAEALELVAHGDGKRLMDRIRAEVAEEEEATDQLLKDRAAVKTQQAGSAGKALLAGGTFGFLALLVVFLFLKQENRQRQLAQAALRQHSEQLQHLVEARTSQLDKANGELQGAIAEQRVAHAALAEIEERTRFALETIQAGAWEMNLETHRIARSAVHDAIFGYAEASAEWTYEKFLEHVVLDDRPIVAASFQQAIAHDGDWNFECRIRRADGEVRWIWAAGRRRHAAGTPRISGIIQDITQRRQAEEKLQLSQELFSTAFANNPAAIALSRFEGGVVLDVNETWLRMTGYDREEIVGRSARHMWPAVEEVRRFLDALRERRTVRGWEQSFRNKAGTLFTAQISAQLLNMRGEEMILTTLVDITELKRAEAAIRASEEQFRLLADSIPNLAWWANGDGYITWYNRQWYEFTGTTPADMEGWGWQRLHDPQILPTVMERWQNSIATGQPFDMEFPLRRADGKFRWFLTRVLPLTDEAGKVQRWFGTNTDVSEAREVREALRQSRAKLEAAFASMNDAVFVSDVNGRFIEFNDAFATFHRFRSKEECLTTLAEYPNILEVYLSDGEPAPLDQWAVTRALRGETMTNAEYKLRRKDTGETWVGSYNFAPIRGHDGRIVGSVVVGRDITSLKQDQEAQSQLASIVRWSDDAIVSESLDGTIRTWNAGAERMFGYAADEVIGRPISLLLPPEQFADEQAALDKLTRGEAAQHYDTVRVAKDGRHIDVALTLSLVKDRHDRVIGTSTIFRDISEIVQARQVLTRSKEELEQLVEERTTKLQEFVGELEHFSYTIIHDMRAPLRAMQGFAELLEQSNPDPQSLKLLQRISNAARRMDMLITDALNYSQTVRQELMLTPVDAGEMLRSMLDTYPELEMFKAQIEIQPPIPAVLANEAGLTQCFSNLLGNAVKFVRPGQLPRIRVFAETEGEWVRIWVADEGVGIPRTMQPRVFDMFSRGHQNYPGTGIGLALVRKVMDRMGGKVGVESEEGQGSRFWLMLRPAGPR